MKQNSKIETIIQILEKPIQMLTVAWILKHLLNY